VIYGLTVQQVGRFFEFRCPQCASQGDLRPLILERSGVVKIYCQTHLDNFGVWASAADMQREKLALAKRIGLLTE